MEWDVFSERMPLVPASTVDQAGPLPTFLDLQLQGVEVARQGDFLSIFADLVPDP